MTNRTVRFAVSAALGLALAGSGRAFAQDNAAPPAEGAPPAGGEAGTTPPPAAAASAAPATGASTDVTLRQGGISVDGDIVINLSKDLVGKPIQIVPNVYYGISNELTVGAAWNPGAEIFQAGGGIAGAPRGLCITGSSNGCEKFLNNLSLDALFSFMRQSTMDLGVHAGLDFLQFSDDLFLSVRAGVKGKMLAGPLVVVFDPALNFGVSKRDLGNKEFLAIPVRVGFMATPQLNLGASIGLFGPLNPEVGGFGDFYTIPIGLGGAFAVNSMLDVRAQFTFTNLAGNDSSADGRALSIGAAYRM